MPCAYAPRPEFDISPIGLEDAPRATAGVVGSESLIRLYRGEEHRRENQLAQPFNAVFDAANGQYTIFCGVVPASIHISLTLCPVDTREYQSPKACVRSRVNLHHLVRRPILEQRMPRHRYTINRRRAIELPLTLMGVHPLDAISDGLLQFADGPGGVTSTLLVDE